MVKYRVAKESNPYLTPTPGLVPIGDTGLYATPDTPASPFDCQRYPSSPYCGSNPIGNPWRDSPADLGIGINNSGCDIGITLNPSIGFVSAPRFDLVYRRPECRNEPDTQYIERETPDFENFQGGTIGNDVFVPEEGTLTSFVEFKWAYPNTAYDISLHVGYGKFTSISCPSSRDDSYYEYTYEGDSIGYFLNGHISHYNPSDGRPRYVKKNAFYLDHGVIVEQEASFYPQPYVAIIYGDKAYLMSVLEGAIRVGNGHLSANIVRCYVGTTCETMPRKTPPPPLPPPKRKCCPMPCCNDNKNDDSLLRLLLQKITEMEEKIKKLGDTIGIDEYPASVPTSFVSKDDGWLGNLLHPGNKSIPNLSQLLIWYVERFDELMGQWEIPIEVKNEDPSTTGNDPKGFKIPNLAEAIAEIMGLLLQTSVNTEHLVNMGARNLNETGQSKQIAFKSHSHLEALLKYFDFGHKDVNQKMHLLYTPGVHTFQEFLTEKEIDVLVTEYTEKISFKAHLHEMLTAAAIIRATHWRKIDKDNPVDGIMSLIKTASKLSDEVAGDKPDANGDTEFDRFIKDVEIGFTDLPGVTDSQHPYGKDFTRRPQIKKLGGTPSTDLPGTGGGV